MKKFLSLEVRKSVLEEFIFIILIFCKTDNFLDLVQIDFLYLTKSDHLDLVKSYFLNLTEFATNDRFFIFSLILLQILSTL